LRRGGRDNFIYLLFSDFTWEPGRGYLQLSV
jgi:hypothetical protein